MIDHNSSESMIQAMSSKGLRITEQRRTLARLFADAVGFLNPKDVYLGLALKHPGLSYDTVYRNLRILQEMGILEQFLFEDGVKFRMGCYGRHHHHHHMICLDCHTIIPLEFCPMHNMEIPDTFQIVRHSFEVYGYCEKCRKQDLATQVVSA
ncbi:Fur family transcriptional regulator [Paenibacillus athensensis]|uniref:Fur family transcriptional regulator n=1 Tax=Paenibacillus athensensis TaxID=1967502 RepID=UPI001E593CDA|nr:Fur family transcriptional regulator [Paenibacillus athensensis]